MMEKRTDAKREIMKYVEIRIEGQLDEHWAEWLGDLTIRRSEQNETLLSGFFPDQAALYGLIGKLRDLGISLISVNSRPAESEVNSQE
jgi:prephenate dehydratase